jgi:hypothetical protein
VPKQALLTHYRMVLNALPDNLKEHFHEDMYKGNGGKGYSIEIEDTEVAAKFVRHLTANPVMWQGPRDDDEAIPIRFRLLPDPEDAARGRRFAPLYD